MASQSSVGFDFHKIRDVKNIPDELILSWLETKIPHLEGIFTRKVSSWRQDVFDNGPPKRRLNLKHEPIVGVTVHQHTVIAERLLTVFCQGKSMKNFSWCFGVGATEACVLLLQEFYNVDHQNAELLLSNGSEPKEVKGSLELLAEGYTVQRTLRSGTISRVVTGPRGTLVIKVCTIAKNRKKSYSRSGECVEVRVQDGIEYNELVKTCAETLKLEDPPPGSELSLFRSDGTLIPPVATDESGSGWVLRDYLKSINRSAAQIRFGVGYINKSPTKTKRTLADLGGTSSRRKKTKCGEEFDIKVLYSAKLGRQGFDLDYSMEREEVFTYIWDLLKKQVMDGISPYHPEDDNYFVVKLSQKQKELLSCDEHGNYTVAENSSDVFRVIHQTTDTVTTEGRCVPLFCVATNHSLSYTYQWESISDGKIGANSPVLWVNKAGSYKCTVSNGSIQCYSELITVADDDVVIVEDKDRDQLGSGDDNHTQSGSEGTSQSESQIEYGGRSDCDGGTAHPDSEPQHSSGFVSGRAFSDIIGSGGFGTVYKGEYKHVNVAVKVLNEEGLANLNRCKHSTLLDTEVNTLKRFRHPNLLILMCYSRNPPALVYPLMENMSLHSNLHDYTFDALSWPKRVSILKDACCGLVYLHGDSPPVVHHDVNSSNILLDKHFAAKLSDFGFSIQLPARKANKTVVTAVEGLPGTDGYRPPEYGDRKFSTRSDVYSFGVVILETYTGLSAYDDDRDGNNLIDYTEDYRSDEKIFNDHSDCRAGGCCQKFSSIFLKLVNMTTKRIPSRRPTSNDVLTQLELIELK